MDASEDRREPTKDDYFHCMTPWWAGTTARHLRDEHGVSSSTEDGVELLYQHMELHGVDPTVRAPTLRWAREGAAKIAARGTSVWGPVTGSVTVWVNGRVASTLDEPESSNVADSHEGELAEKD
jgi:hypothetical protein